MLLTVLLLSRDALLKYVAADPIQPSCLTQVAPSLRSSASLDLPVPALCKQGHCRGPGAVFPWDSCSSSAGAPLLQMGSCTSCQAGGSLAGNAGCFSGRLMGCQHPQGFVFGEQQESQLCATVMLCGDQLRVTGSRVRFWAICALAYPQPTLKAWWCIFRYIWTIFCCLSAESCSSPCSHSPP